MKWIAGLASLSKRAARTPWRRCASLASCLIAVGCVSEGAPEELGVAQFTRGQPVQGLTPTSQVDPAKAANEPMRDAAPTSGPAMPAMRNQMAPLQAGAPAAGAAAMPPRAQEMMATAMPKTPAAGGAAPATAGAGAAPPAAGAAAPPPSGQNQGTTEPGAPEQPTESAGPGMLSVAFTSVGPGGRYAPRNCGAVWIEDESGTFVKTIERWTAIRESYLGNWRMASGGWGFSIFGGGGNNPDQVDVVTAGTLSRHQMHMSTWNMKNVDGEVVPDGKYQVVVEVSEGNSEVGRVEFVKGPMPQMLKGESSVFSNMTVTYSR